MFIHSQYALWIFESNQLTEKFLINPQSSIKWLHCFNDSHRKFIVMNIFHVYRIKLNFDVQHNERVHIHIFLHKIIKMFSSRICDTGKNRIILGKALYQIGSFDRHISMPRACENTFGNFEFGRWWLSDRVEIAFCIDIFTRVMSWCMGSFALIIIMIFFSSKGKATLNPYGMNDHLVFLYIWDCPV